MRGRCRARGGAQFGRTRARVGRDLGQPARARSEEHTSELQSRLHLVCRLLLEKKKTSPYNNSQVLKNQDVAGCGQFLILLQELVSTRGRPPKITLPFIRMKRRP